MKQVHARLENGGTLVMPNTVRKYQDSMRELWEVMKDGFTDTPEYWIVKNWVHRFAMTSVYKGDLRASIMATVSILSHLLSDGRNKPACC